MATYHDFGVVGRLLAVLTFPFASSPPSGRLAFVSGDGEMDIDFFFGYTQREQEIHFGHGDKKGSSSSGTL